jgi:hypothetical protein
MARRDHLLTSHSSSEAGGDSALASPPISSRIPLSARGAI